MKSVRQVKELTGVSARTLQYYDEIGLLRPSELTQAGYRLYNEEALQRLQQILFYKELGFTLKEIKELLCKPEFDKISAYKKQKELFLLKRNRTDRLIQLLSRLEKGDTCMSFKEFDLTDYIQELENFKKNSMESVVKYWGSVDNFDLFINKVKEDESKVAKIAIKQYGSVEKYTEAMKYNLEHFSEIMEQQMTPEAKRALQKNEELYSCLTADLTRDVCTKEIHDIVKQIEDFTIQNAVKGSIGKDFWRAIIQSYSNDYGKAVTDSKYGNGASDYIVKAFRTYFQLED